VTSLFVICKERNAKIMSLRYKVISIFILAVVLPSLLFGIILTSISRSSIKDSIFYRQQEIVKRLADRINSQIDRHQKLLFTNRDIASLPRAKQTDSARSILQLGDSFTEIGLVDTRGAEVWKYKKGENSSTALYARGKQKKEFVKIPLGNFYISPVYFSSKRQPFITLAVALSNGKGFLVAKLDFEQMWQWIAEVKIGDSGNAFIVDKKGNLLAHMETERVLAHSNFRNLPVVEDFIKGREPSSERWSRYKDERGEEVVALYQSLPKLGWAVITQIPAREVYQPIHSMYKYILFWTLVLTAVFLVAGYQLVQRIIGPLSVLEAGATQISQGRLDIKLNIKTGDEIEALAKNFEKMAEALKKLEDIKQDLTRMIIHDLKSPLSGIMGSLDYLESGMMGEITPDQKKIVTLAKKSSENMLDMIQNLLDVAKMEEGKLELKKEEFDLKVMAAERKQEFETLVRNERKTLSVDAVGEIPKISAEKHLIERVLNNLISNAVHHTSGGGKIFVGIKKIEGFVEVSVSDDGAGIPPEYLDKIFEKFVQVDRRKAQLRTGAGLGLTFCRMVVETHGGKIRVESELNKGSAFIFFAFHKNGSALWFY